MICNISSNFIGPFLGTCHCRKLGPSIEKFLVSLVSPSGRLPSSVKDQLACWLSRKFTLLLFSFLLLLIACFCRSLSSYLSQRILVWNSELKRNVFTRFLCRGYLTVNQLVPKRWRWDRTWYFWQDNLANVMNCSRKKTFILFSCPGQLNRWPCHSLTH